MEPALRLETGILALYTRQFAALFGAGLPMVRALKVLSVGPHAGLNGVLEQVAVSVNRGESLSRAMARHPSVFSHFYVQMVRLGEATGGLERALARLAGQLESQARQGERLRAALFYPALQLVASGAILALLVAFVLPGIQPLLENLGVPLPWPTRVLLEVARLATNPVVWVALALAWPSWKLIRQDVERVDTLRLRRAQVLDRLPVLGRLLRVHAQARVLEALGLLLESGLPLADAMNVLEQTCDDALLRHKLGEARRRLELSGIETVAELFEQHDVFGATTVQMIRSAEESGQMVFMLRRSAYLLEMEAAGAVETLLAMMEPAIMIVIGGMVGFIVISAYLPLVKVLSSL
ncbi:MAG: type II secretion system F family protein [Candidatus Eremiobacterota bacterium]